MVRGLSLKKTISIITCFCLMACLATASFAATDVNASFPNALVSKGDGNTYIGVLDALGLGAQGRAFYDEFKKVLQGEPADPQYQYLAFLRSDSLSGYPTLFFIRIPSDVKVSYSAATGGKLTFDKSHTSISLSWYSGTKNEDGSMQFSYKTENQNVNISNTFFKLGTYKTVAMCSSNFNYDSSFTSTVADFLNPTQQGDLGFVDNIPDASEPDPPLPPVDPPKPPVIPQGDPTYVPYDTSIWNKFLAYVQGNIGSATNIGFLIFAAIFGIWLVIKVVKWFTKG